MNEVAVQLPCHVWLFVTPWTVACQASLSLSISRSLPKFMSTELVMPSNHFILYLPLLLPSISQYQGLFQWVGWSHQWMKCISSNYWNWRSLIRIGQSLVNTAINTDLLWSKCYDLKGIFAICRKGKCNFLNFLIFFWKT